MGILFVLTVNDTTGDVRAGKTISFSLQISMSWITNTQYCFVR